MLDTTQEVVFSERRIKALGVLNVTAAVLYVFSALGTPAAHAQSTPTTLTIGGQKYTLCAAEHQVCSFSGSEYVVFGTTSPSLVYSVNGPFKSSVSCTNGSAAPTDPAPGYVKSCWYGSAPPAPPVTTTGITCASPKTATGGTPKGLITADTPSTDGSRMFAQGSAFNVAFVTSAPAADTASWTMQDYLGNVKGSGTFPVSSGTQTNTLSCTSTASGYFAITATLLKAGGTLPNAGTRPTGIATFAITPNLSAVLPAVTFAHQEQHRFGWQGFSQDGPMLSVMGISQEIDNRQLSAMEPNGPNTWTPSLADLAPFYQSGNTLRLVRLDGIPAWASPTGAYEDDTNAPTNLTYYQNYMARVGTDSAAIHTAYFPKQLNNYYQVTWEPQWADSAANFVAMYAAVYNGVHSTDPHAVVMGPTNGFPANCVTECTAGFLKTYAPYGLGKYIDGVSTHSYYDAGTYPAHPPERYDTNTDPAAKANALDQLMRELRAEMQTVKPNMPLWSTEVGISYDSGAAYGPNYPTGNELYGQAAVAVRTHLIVLGEGAQVTYFFYGADYPSEVGYGTFFDIVDPTGAFGATNVSPKPEAAALAAMTRVIDGTQTLGYLNGLPSMVYGYAFQQLGGGKVVTALWTHNNTDWPTSTGQYSSTYSTQYSLAVDAPGTSGNVTVLDMMGNPTSVAYQNGAVSLTLTESPIYVVSTNATTMKAQVTVPVGYTGQ